eukprot:c14682_g1_i1 orf=2-304(-)
MESLKRELLYEGLGQCESYSWDGDPMGQWEYIDKVLERFCMENSKPLSTPLPPYVKISKEDYPKSKEDKAFMEKTSYASVMIHMIHCTQNHKCNILCSFFL